MNSDNLSHYCYSRMRLIPNIHNIFSPRNRNCDNQMGMECGSIPYWISSTWFERSFKGTLSHAMSH